MLATDLYLLADQHYARKRELAERAQVARERGDTNTAAYLGGIATRERATGDAYYHAAELAQAASLSLVADIDRGANNAATPTTAAHLRIAADHVFVCLR